MHHLSAVCPACEGSLVEGRGSRLACGACGFEGRVRTDLTEGLTVEADRPLTPPGAPAVVTPTRFMHGGTTFPVATLSSYTHSFVPEQRTRADRTLPTVLFVAGAAVLLAGVWRGSGGVALLGGMVAVTALAWWGSLRDRVVPALHRLTVVSAGGASRTIEGDEATVDAVHAALDRAVDAQRPLPS